MTNNPKYNTTFVLPAVILVMIALAWSYTVRQVCIYDTCLSDNYVLSSNIFSKAPWPSRKNVRILTSKYFDKSGISDTSISDTGIADTGVARTEIPKGFEHYFDEKGKIIEPDYKSEKVISLFKDKFGIDISAKNIQKFQDKGDGVGYLPEDKNGKDFVIAKLPTEDKVIIIKEPSINGIPLKILTDNEKITTIPDVYSLGEFLFIKDYTNYNNARYKALFSYMGITFLGILCVLAMRKKDGEYIYKRFYSQNKNDLLLCSLWEFLAITIIVLYCFSMIAIPLTLRDLRGLRDLLFSLSISTPGFYMMYLLHALRKQVKNEAKD